MVPRYGLCYSSVSEMKSKPDQEHRTLPGTHDVVGFSGALVVTPFQESPFPAMVC
jgi:hypothetical protein